MRQEIQDLVPGEVPWYWARHPAAPVTEETPEFYKILVCGGRDYANKDRVFAVLDAYAAELPVSHVIHGGARGADSLAGEWARARGVQEVICPANWEQFGKRAGYMRNAAMTDLQPDEVIAFPGGAGTSGMMKLARLCDIPVRVIK